MPGLWLRDTVLLGLSKLTEEKETHPERNQTDGRVEETNPRSQGEKTRQVDTLGR